MPGITLREKILHTLDHKMPIHVGMHAHANMTGTRKAKGRDDLVHHLRQVHNAETQRSDGKGGDDGSAKRHTNFIGKSLSGKANRLHCINFKSGSCQKGNS